MTTLTFPEHAESSVHDPERNHYERNPNSARSVRRTAYAGLRVWTTVPLLSCLTHTRDRRRHRARIALRPAAGIDLDDEIADKAVELVRILDVDGVAAVRHHRKRGSRDVLLHQQGGLQAGPVLVARQHQCRGGHRLHLVDEIVERGALALYAELGVGGADGGMLSEALLELRKAARVFVFKLHPGRAVGVFLREGGHAFGAQSGDNAFNFFVEFVLLALLRAIAAARNRERQGAMRVPETEMQGREPTHGQADDMRLVDPQMVQHRGD